MYIYIYIILNFFDSHICNTGKATGCAISQLSAYCIMISSFELIITHSAPLSIAVYLHQTLVDSVSSSKTNLTTIGVTPNSVCVWRVIQSIVYLMKFTKHEL